VYVVVTSLPNSFVLVVLELPIVVGGGTGATAKVPVYYDGTNWRIG